MSSIPLQSNLPRTYRIIHAVQNTPQVQTFTLDGSVGAKPGQFVMAWLPGVDEVPLSVAFDNGEQMKLTFFAVGDMTNELAKKGVGDLIGIRGPYGTFYDWKEGEHILLVAGGYGAAPMYFVAHHIAQTKGCTLDVIVGARTRQHLLYVNELKALPHTTIHVVTDDGSEGIKGFTIDPLRELLTKGGMDQVFACGPELMLKRVFDITEEFSVPAQIATARYMKCGYGLCGTCCLEPLGIRQCTDGPIFKSEVLRKIEEYGVYARDGYGRKDFFDGSKKFDGMGKK